MPNDDYAKLQNAKETSDSKSSSNAERGNIIQECPFWTQVKLVNQNQKPLKNVSYLLLAQDEEKQRGKTDANGIARIENIPKGRYTFSVQLLTDKHSYQIPKRKFPPPETDWLQARLVNQNKEPMANVDYLAVDRKKNEYKGKTDDDGKVILKDIPKGECKVCFPILTEKYSYEIPKRAPLPPDWLEVRLVNQNKEPVANVDYLAVDRKGSEYKGKTNYDGKVILKGIPKGECKVYFPILTEKYNYEIPKREPLPPLTDWLQARLLDQNQKPIADCEYLIITSDNQEHKGKTDAEGRIRLEDVAKGKYQISFPSLAAQLIQKT